MVTNGLLRYTDGYGETLGARDNGYRPPSGTTRARYDGFEYGGDCWLRVVANSGLVLGDPSAQLRVQCTSDEDFFQDVYTCSNPRRASLEIPDPTPAPPPEPSVPEDLKKWECTTSDPSALGAAVTMQLDEDSMRLVAHDDDLTYEGVRDRDYRPQHGSYIEYDDFEYGGDCSLSAVVEERALIPATSSVTLKVRCAGDDFVQGVYRCTAP